MALTEGQNAKTCRKCGRLKHFDQFYTHKACKYGVKGTCKTCYKRKDIEDRYNKSLLEYLTDKYITEFRDKLNQSKFCTGCDKYKSFDKFSSGKGKYNLDSQCKVCDKEYYEANSEYFIKRNVKRKRLRRLINDTIQRNYEEFRDKLNQSKFCTKCGEYKLFSCYVKNKSGRFGLNSSCKSCKYEEDKKYYEKSNIKDRVYRRNVIKNSFERNLDDFKCWVLEIKQCGNCKEYKDFNKFRKRNRKFGLTTKCIDCLNEYQNERRNNNPAVKLRSNMTSRMNLALKHGYKSDKTKNLIGCSINKLKEHLEDQFEEGMTWDSREEWHIDHEIPVSVFDLDDFKQQKVAFHWSNVQPLWAKDNRKKHDKIPNLFKGIELDEEFFNRYKLI